MNNYGINKVDGINKRQFLKGLTAIIGATAASQFASGNALAVALDYQGQKNSAAKAGKLFSHQQMKILHDICSVVLPRTNTPSAAELDVHGFIDHQLTVCYSSEHQKQAKMIVDKVDSQCFKLYKKSFIELTTEQQTQLLVDLEQKNIGFDAKDKQQFKGLKSLLVFGYLTTEVGATQVLSYQAVPGGFKGSIPYKSVGKTYGSLAFY